MFFLTPKIKVLRSDEHFQLNQRLLAWKSKDVQGVSDMDFQLLNPLMANRVRNISTGEYRGTDLSRKPRYLIGPSYELWASEEYAKAMDLTFETEEPWTRYFPNVEMAIPALDSETRAINVLADPEDAAALFDLKIKSVQADDKLAAEMLSYQKAEELISGIAPLTETFHGSGRLTACLTLDVALYLYLQGDTSDSVVSVLTAWRQSVAARTETETEARYRVTALRTGSATPTLRYQSEIGGINDFLQENLREGLRFALTNLDMGRHLIDEPCNRLWTLSLLQGALNDKSGQ